jgi:hypothetical protein
MMVHEVHWLAGLGLLPSVPKTRETQHPAVRALTCESGRPTFVGAPAERCSVAAVR